MTEWILKRGYKVGTNVVVMIVMTAQDRVQNNNTVIINWWRLVINTLFNMGHGLILMLARAEIVSSVRDDRPSEKDKRFILPFPESNSSRVLMP